MDRESGFHGPAKSAEFRQGKLVVDVYQTVHIERKRRCAANLRYCVEDHTCHIIYILVWATGQVVVLSSNVRCVFCLSREFYYIQMEKYARQAIAEGVKNAVNLHVTIESELYRVLVLHYNRNNRIEVSWCEHGMWAWGASMGCEHGMWAWDVSIGCEHEMWAWDVSMRCEHGMWACMGCEHGMWAWDVSMGCEHRMWAWDVSMGCEHEMWAWAVSMHGMRAWDVSMGCEHEMWAWDVSMRCEHGMWAWDVSMGWEHGMWAWGCEHGMWAWDVSMGCEHGIWAWGWVSWLGICSMVRDVKCVKQLH